MSTKFLNKKHEALCDEVFYTSVDNEEKIHNSIRETIESKSLFSQLKIFKSCHEKSIDTSKDYANCRFKEIDF
jgi:hypothetical protein